MGLVEVEYRELLDGDDEVVGYIDPDGVVHEFGGTEGQTAEYRVEQLDTRDERRVVGDPILVPEYALDLFDGEEFIIDEE